MVINYKQIRTKYEEVRQILRAQLDMTPLITLAQAVTDAYEASLELPAPTWVDPENNRHRYVSCGAYVQNRFTPMPLSEIASAGQTGCGTVSEKVFSFIIKTIIDTTPQETAGVYTSVSVRENADHKLSVNVEQSAVPLSTGDSPYVPVCEAIQYHVMNEIESFSYVLTGEKK